MRMGDSYLDQFRIPEGELESSDVRKVSKGKVVKGRVGKRRKIGPEEFVMKIPLPWISKAAHLSRKSLHVAIAVWYLYGLNVKKKGFKIERRTRDCFNVTAETCNKTLRKMEQAGLVTVERLPGQLPLVSVVLVEEYTLPG